jgi:predicted ATPase
MAEPLWQIELLGEMRVVGQGQVLTRFESRRAMALLAYLALHPQRRPTREELIDRIWPDAPLEAGRNRLKQALSSLRRQLEPPPLPSGSVFEADKFTIGLRTGAVTTDVTALERALGRGDRAAAQRLWKGELLPGLYDDWVQTQRERLNALYEPLAAAEIPVAVGAAVEVAPKLTAPASTVMLPVPVTRFFGRESEQKQLLALLAEERWVSLMGTGGMGKTRLAIEVARHWEQGDVWFVPLAELSDLALLGGTLATALHLPLRPPTDPLEQVQAFLGERPALLVLDNAEQLVILGLALPLRALLERCPKVRLLVTTQKILGGDGECVLALEPLSLPQSDNPVELARLPSVQLFLDRAQRVRPDVGITSRNAATLATLCRRLDGIPLALELVAAWAQALSPTQILARLEAGDTTLTTSRRRDVPDRHRSLYAAFEGSLQLLTPEARRFFLRFSVFRGGASLEAAQHVCDEPAALALLAELMEASMIQRHASKLGTLRFSVLESLRQFATEHLMGEEEGQALKRHTQYFQAQAQSYKRLAPQPEQEIVDEADWIHFWTREWDNLACVIQSLERSSQPTAIVELLCTLEEFWSYHGHLDEACFWLEHALLQDGISVAARISAQTRIAHRLWKSRGIGWAETLLRQCLAEAQREQFPEVAANAMLCLARNLHHQKHHEEAMRLLESLQQYALDAQLPLIQSSALRTMANICIDQRNPEPARHYQEQAERLLQETPYLGMRTLLLYDQSRVAFISNQYDVAAQMLEECLEGALRLDDGILLGQAYNLYGESLRHLGNELGGIQALIASIQSYARLRDSFGMHYPTWNLSYLLSEYQSFEFSVPILAFSVRLWQDLALVALTTSEAEQVAEIRQSSEQDLGRERTDYLWRKGWAFSMDDLSGFAEGALIFLKK